MKPASRALRALPFTFVLYVLEAGLASLAVLPLGLELLTHLRATSWDATQHALLLESAPLLAPALRVGGGSLLLALLLAAVLSPWLQMSWLSVLAGPTSLLRALGQGLRLLFRAWWVSAWVALVALVLFLPFLLIGYAVHAGLSASTDARVHDLALLAALAPLLPAALFTCLLHDLARACALEQSALKSVLRALRAALRLRTQLRMLALTLVGYGLVALAQWLVGELDGFTFRFLLTGALLQGALLARLYVRSLWLASALTCVRDELHPSAVEA